MQVNAATNQTLDALFCWQMTKLRPCFMCMNALELFECVRVCHLSNCKQIDYLFCHLKQAHREWEKTGEKASIVFARSHQQMQTSFCTEIQMQREKKTCKTRISPPAKVHRWQKRMREDTRTWSWKSPISLSSVINNWLFKLIKFFAPVFVRSKIIACCCCCTRDKRWSSFTRKSIFI